MNCTVTEHFIKYDTSKMTFSAFSSLTQLPKSFVLKIDRLPTPISEPKTVLSFGEALQINIGVLKFPDDIENLSDYRKGECYDAYCDDEGNSPYIEAVITLFKDENDRDGRKMSLGLPLLKFPIGEVSAYLLFDGVRFAWIYGGEAVNINFPCGYLRVSERSLPLDILNAEIAIDTELLCESEATETLEKSAAFYSARGYNAWAGDVVNFYHNGVYHLIVLLDRHHHGNRFGGGAHSAYHMTTKDFINWENHGEMYRISTQWESFGTGTMFYSNGKYCYSHGLHTSRIITKENTGSRLLREQYSESGSFNAVSYDTLEANGLYPSGACYMISDDGISFTPARKQFHTAENPSIYSEPDGSLTMYAGYGNSGVWHAPSIDGPWIKTDTSMPIAERSSPVKNSTECPSIFSWNGFKYIIMGFTGFWQSEQNSDVFTDKAASGDDIYDGLSVPMVAECDGRYILSGWVCGTGWGYVTQHRELLQKENGRLGIRWLKEFVPDISKLKPIVRSEIINNGLSLTLDPKGSYYLELKVSPKSTAKVGLGFCGVGNPFNFELLTQKKKVQAAFCDRNGISEEIKALAEYIKVNPDGTLDGSEVPGSNTHRFGHNFSIINVEEIESDYKLRMILHYEPKTDNLIIDAEIGGGRTFISNRRYFKAERLTFSLTDAEAYELFIGEMPTSTN